ncbi:TPA: hypothetical protein ACTXXA_002783 [Legionella anisa]
MFYYSQIFFILFALFTVCTNVLAEDTDYVFNPNDRHHSLYIPDAPPKPLLFYCYMPARALKKSIMIGLPD